MDRDRASLAVELLQNGGPKFVAVDRLRQIALKARRTHAGVSPMARPRPEKKHADLPLFGLAGAGSQSLDCLHCPII